MSLPCAVESTPEEGRDGLFSMGTDGSGTAPVLRAAIGTAAADATTTTTTAAACTGYRSDFSTWGVNTREIGDAWLCKVESGGTALSLGNTAEAIEHFNKALETISDADCAYLGLGLAFYPLEDDAKAIANLRKYLTFDSTSEYAASARTILTKLHAGLEQ
jgi:tetratricopeptide (TPR) repeat protein